jgi:membrane-anchored protein YejM (alkaline phosphatase superfamily)
MFPISTGQNQINFKTNAETFFDILKKSNYHVYSLIPDITFFKESTINFGDKTLFIFEDRKKLQRLEDNLGNKIIAKLKSKEMEEPWIYFIHLMDIHTPFSVPEEFDKKENGETKYDRLVSYVDIWLGKFLKHIDMKNTLVIITADHGEYIPVTGESITEIPKIQRMLTKGQTSLSFVEKIRMKTLLNLRFAAQTYK